MRAFVSYIHHHPKPPKTTFAARSPLQNEPRQDFQAAQENLRVDQEVQGAAEGKPQGAKGVCKPQEVHHGRCALFGAFFPVAQEENDPRQGRVLRVRQNGFIDQGRFHPQGSLVRRRRQAAQGWRCRGSRGGRRDRGLGRRGGGRGGQRRRRRGRREELRGQRDRAVMGSL